MASWRSLDGVKLIVGDKCMGMLEAVGEVFPDTKYQIRYNKGPVDKSKKLLKPTAVPAE